MGEQYIYHLVPKPLHGDVLYPLNQLREIEPQLAATHLQKCAGCQLR